MMLAQCVQLACERPCDRHGLRRGQRLRKTAARAGGRRDAQGLRQRVQPPATRGLPPPHTGGRAISHLRHPGGLFLLQAAREPLPPHPLRARVGRAAYTVVQVGRGYRISGGRILCSRCDGPLSLGVCEGNGSSQPLIVDVPVL